jgi:NADPH2 dehydrogenase
MIMSQYKLLGTIKNSLSYLAESAISLNYDEALSTGSQSSFAQTYTLPDGLTIGNRFCIQPMEGWDGTADGKPTDLIRRRWNNFGRSGAKLIWGCEAAAVCHEGRANPNQLVINDENLPEITSLLHGLVATHKEKYSNTDDLMVGLQLTHSGRFSRPNQKTRSEPVILYHHPYLDKKVGISSDFPTITDDEIKRLIDKYIVAAKLAAQAGFRFIDIKHCHGYLGHEFLSARNRVGSYGGSFENRTRFLREIVSGIRSTTPEIRLAVRLSAFDFIAFEPDPITHIGKPVLVNDYPSPFGSDLTNPLKIDLSETVLFLQLLQQLGINMVNITAGSPYYSHHIQRPALYPPSDGYQPPEDPLVGVSRQINACASLKQQFPDMLLVGTAYSYLQEWLPYVAQYNLRNKMVDFIGIGRLVLSYPDYPNDILSGNSINKQHLCRTFSDCTTAPRIGLVSGCYPLDPEYKNLPEYKTLHEYKTQKKTK